MAAAYALALLGYAPSEASDTANTIFSALAIALVPVIVFVVVDRWLKATPDERRALRPLVLAGPPALVVVAITIADDYIGISLSQTGTDAVHWSALVYTTIRSPSSWAFSASACAERSSVGSSSS